MTKLHKINCNNNAHITDQINAALMSIGDFQKHNKINKYGPQKFQRYVLFFWLYSFRLQAHSFKFVDSAVTKLQYKKHRCQLPLDFFFCTFYCV